MNPSHEAAYIIDPAMWVRNVLGVEPTPWQEEFLRAKLLDIRRRIERPHKIFPGVTATVA